LFFESQLQIPTDLGWVAVDPGAFDQSPSGIAVAGLGNGTLPTLRPTGVCRRYQSQALHEFSWGVKTGQVTHFGHQGDGDGKLHAPQGLKRLDHRVETPGLNLILPFLVETLEAFGVIIHRPDIVLKDDLLSRWGADDFRKPSEVGRVRMGPAYVADILPEQEGLESELGGLEIADGVFTRPGGIPDGFIFGFGDRDRREITGSCQAGQVHGIAAIRFDPVPWLFGNQRGGHPPAVVTLLGQIALEPVAAGTGFIDKDQVFGF